MDADRRREAEDLLASGRIHEALSILNKSIEQERAADPEILYLLGVAHFRLGDFSIAESDLRKAISLDPSRADAFYYLGLAAERQKHNGNALKAYQTALALNPTLEKAREKVDRLRGVSTEATSNAVGLKTGAKQPESELVLPTTDAEFVEYERRRRKKEEIDQRAVRDAEVNLSHEAPEVFSRLPWWYKVGAAAFAVFFAFILIILTAGGLFLFLSFSRTVSEGGGTLEEKTREEKRLNEDVWRDEAHKIFCDQAKRQGLTPPDC